MGLLRTVARRLGVENRLRHSPVCERFWRWKQPERFAAIRKDRAFFEAVLAGRRLACVFDVGANIGDKADVFADMADRVVCVEPDPDAAAALRIRFRNRPHVVIEQAAVASEPGELILYRRADAHPVNTLSERFARHSEAARTGDRLPVPVTTLDHLVGRYGRPDFLKVDVEGFESEVFRGLSVPVPLVCFEALVPIFLDGTLAVVERLAQLSPAIQFNARPCTEYRLIHQVPLGPGEMGEWLKSQVVGRNDYNGPMFDVFAYADL